MDEGLGERLFQFALKTIKFCKTIKYSIENKVLVNQLVKSATSSGANFEEAQSASSKADFKHKIDISLREMRESNYWLRIFKHLESTNSNLDFLIKESEELKKILGSISSKVAKSIKWSNIILHL